MIKKREIIEELKQAECQQLCDTFKESYIVPADYFSSLSKSLTNNIEHLNPNKKNKSSGFSISNNYFNALPAIILSKIGKRKEFLLNKKYYLAAASIVLVMISVLFLSKSVLFSSHKIDLSSMDVIKKPIIINNQSIDQELDALNENEIVDFLNENGHDVNAALLASLDENNLTINGLDDFDILENANDYLYPFKQAVIKK